LQIHEQLVVTLALLQQVLRRLVQQVRLQLVQQVLLVQQVQVEQRVLALLLVVAL
jgi:hypothetical protein